MWAALLLFLQPPDPAATAQFEPLYRAELAARQAQYGSRHPRVAQALRDLALFLKANGKPAESVTLLRQALAIDERPQDLITLAQLVPPAEAAVLLERSLKLKPSGEAHHRLADLLAASRQFDAARAHYLSAISLYTAESSPQLGVALNDLGFLDESLERFPQAEANYRKALAAHRKTYGNQHPEVGITLNNLASTISAQGRAAEAEPLLRQALTILEQTLGPHHERTAACAANLADLLSALNRKTAARALYDRAIAIYERLGQRDNAEQLRARR
jgi:hypothetical protein